MSNPVDQMDERFLRMNLLITQGILLIIAGIASLFVHTWETFTRLFFLSNWLHLIYGAGFAILIVSLSEGLERIVPADWVADGEINQRIFRRLSLIKTLAFCVLVGFAEEWLFRGVIQYALEIGRAHV